MVCAGLSAWSSEPELYQNTSDMSPVDRRVLTMLSPSLPPGRVSVSILIVGLARMKASVSALAVAVVPMLLSTRNFSVTEPSAASPEPAPEPEPHEVRAAVVRTARAAPAMRCEVFTTPLRVR